MKKRNWPAIIDRLNESKSGKTAIRMGTPGSAQVTRVRLLRDYNNLSAFTDGPFLYLEAG